jgi:TATA-binding protein-associated factor Taf7
MNHELTRRSLSTISPTAPENPAQGIKVWKGHYQAVLDNVNAAYNAGLTVNPSVTNPYKTMATGDIIKTSDITDSIKYIQGLMSQIVPVN